MYNFFMNYRRVFIQNSYVHLVILAYKRQNIFTDNIELLRCAFKNAKKYFKFEILTICVLPNHIHMILKPDNISEYPRIITSIKYYFSKNINYVGQECPTYGYMNKRERGIFQRRYYEHTIKSEDEFNNHINYIHFNPVKHGLVNAVKDWEYSSFHQFVKKGLYEVNWGSEADVESIKNLDFG